MNLPLSNKQFPIKAWFMGLMFGLIVSPQLLAALNIAQTPLFLTQAAKPIVMLNISNDHQLYFKAFDDYSDLDGDGVPETTYKHSFDYYGYFDSYKCYEYDNNRFEPDSITADKYCSGDWSGNFLNWASMARIDTIRKMLYGGFRSTDNSDTVLERTFIPTDAHSFAKFYSGADLTRLTPFTALEVANGITLCNTTVSSSGTNLSQNVTSPPLIRVAKGDFSLWASHERYQCQWRGSSSVSTGTQDTDNGNNSALSGINANNRYPYQNSDRLGGRDFIARVKVCASIALIGQEDCKAYNASLKPVGILQNYGDEDKIRFGLMTGSYRNHISGGVLRKNVGVMTDEINVATDGTFKSTLPTDSIINTLNSLRTYGYQYRDGNYFDDNGSDHCDFNVSDLTDNEECTNWGNPQSEIYLESLRYLAGQSASAAFVTDDSTFISNLTSATFVDPIPSDEWCSPINVIQFNASTSSYDANELAGATDLGIVNLNTTTDAIGTGEGLSGKYFVGENGTDNNQLCTAKTVSNLSSVRGTCPDGPRLQGSYHIAGLAHYAHTNSIRSDRQGDQLVTTYGVALTPSLPKAVVPIPGSNDSITILPACQNTRENTNCSIVDYKIVVQNHAANPATGRLYINWETGEQGGDYDQDMWGVLDYSVTSTHVTITTDVFNESTGAGMAFGYVINGTTKDAFHAHTGINGYSYTDPTGVLACNNCRDGGSPSEPATSVIYTIGTTDGQSLEQPLFYAAKWGGFVDSNDNDTPDITAEWDKDGDGLPDRYFFAINPQEIADALALALDTVLLESGSSSSVATNSTRLDTNTVIYQAKFNSSNWTGQLLSFRISADGSIAPSPSWDAGAILTTQGLANRSVFSYNADTNSGIAFVHGNLSATQQGLLTANQVEYFKGDQTNEQPIGALRKRSGPNWLLGDIINSDPWFIGNTSFGFHLLPRAGDGTATVESADYVNFRASSVYKARKPILAIGSNDGMLHIFDATISLANSGKEVFAYVPDSVMSKLVDYTLPTYTSAGQHRYYVDGSPTAGDAYFDADGDTDNEWRTVVVATTGAGGSSSGTGSGNFAGGGIFALDVTFIDPTYDDYSVAETAFSSNRVLWEINQTTAPTASDLISVAGPPAASIRHGFADNLGLTLGQASVVRMADGHYAAVFGNGYNSTNHVAVLYIVDIATGALIKAITTEVGDSSSPNGLSTPITIDMNGDRIIDAVYAGDLLGNMWKFDVSDDDPTNWGVAFVSGSTPKPLYIAKDPSNATQPITGKPQVGLHPNGGVMVYFGTGKYFETGDNIVGGSPQVQTFYGIWDECVSVTDATVNCNHNPADDRTDLVEQTIDAEGVITTLDVNGDVIEQFDVRQTSKNDVDYSTKKGWYMDLVTPPQPGTAEGERVVSFPLLRNNRIIFTTLIPDDASCSFGGTGWLMELEALTGKRLTKSPFDLTGDNEINVGDQITIFDTDDDGEIDGSDTVGASGKKSKVGMIKTPGIINAGDKEYKFTSGSTGALEGTTESAPSTSGRQSWIQLR